MEELRVLSDEECKEIKGGEAITLTGVMAILAIAIVAVICYRFRAINFKLASGLDVYV